MADCFIGEIRPFAGDYAPEGWVLCWGQLLSIAQYQVLYSLIGTTYGGDGSTTFAVPDLRGRLPVGQGQGTGLTNRVVGQTGGSSTVQLSQAQLPAHNHSFSVSGNDGSSTSPAAGSCLAHPAAQAGGDINAYVSPSASPAPTVQSFASGVVSTTPGGSQPHANVMPSLAINYIIATTGLYPQRS